MISKKSAKHQKIVMYCYKTVIQYVFDVFEYLLEKIQTPTPYLLSEIGEF